mgnify:CR=1 FL=1
MNEDNNNLDLLDLDDDTGTVDTLPEAAPFATPRSKKPWLLLGIGVVVIILATYIIVRTVGGNSSSSIDVDLDAPEVVVDGADTIDVPQPTPDVAPSDAAPAPAQPVQVAPAPTPAPQPKPVAAPVQETAGVPVRVVEDRKAVTFNPDKPVAKQPVAKKPAAKKPVQKAAPKKTVKQQIAPAHGGWYVQFGSYSTRALAENAQRQIQRGHQNLFAGKQFVILAAQVKGGTIYRLRIAFANAAAANGFCRNAKSDGLDCYVAK